MKKQEFTKEEIETTKLMWNDYHKYTPNMLIGFEVWLDSLLKPETKFIDVRIEYESLGGFDLKSYILNCFPFANTKVTELPEVFTREEVKLFTKYCIDNGWIHLEKALDNWLDERKSK